MKVSQFPTETPSLDEGTIVRDLDRRSFLRKIIDSSQVIQRATRPHGTKWTRLHVRVWSLLPIQRPIFILGCPRSGTTFLGELIESLPRISYYYEPPALKYYARLIYQNKVTYWQARLAYELNFRLLLLRCPGNGARIAEKNPAHTWIAETLYGMFPDAKFLVINRDGRDTALSLMRKPWHLASSSALGKRDPGEYLYGPYPHFYIEPTREREYMSTSDFHRCIWIWRRFADKVQQLKRSIPARAQHHLRYEDLVLSPETTIPPLLDFLGENDSASSHSVMQAAAQGFKSSIGRWKTELTEEQKEVAESEAGEALRDAGYSLS
ncbi:MAG: sulfotransferase [Verrucomicrobia bacterium]|nr:sulfotransferase [Verrucomicrobiota bacterium]